MRDFAKSILNYFAAFSETRFRFNKRLSYEWADDASTLDLSVFPEFERELLAAISGGKPFQIDVLSGRYTVCLDQADVRASMTAVVTAELNADFLKTQIDGAEERLQEALPEDEQDGIEQRVLDEGLRQYNLAFRHAMLRTLTDMQERKIADLRTELGFTSVPPSTFNPQREVQRLYDDLMGLARNRTHADGYVDEVVQYLAEQPYAYTIFDLHLSLRRFLQFIGTQTIHAFFHEISADGGQKYPLFSVEVMGSDGSESITIQTVRDVVMLNTPAVNSFEFDTVLTTPRACRFSEYALHLSALERFLQAKFKVGEAFMLVSLYRPLVGEKLPTVRYRIGLQAVKDEDRRILDYSELITTLDEGAGHKFIDMVSRYVDGNVENTASAVDKQYRERYPRGSAEHLVPKHLTVPIPLNETQRRILTALENPKNEIIVVDGPPGTGKSYTITALVYLANQLGKSVVVTSHKRQALDVIDQALTEQFKQLHPQAKPSVLRFEKGRGPAGINSVQNTLSGQAVNAAHRRAQALNNDAVESDRDRTRLAVARENDEFWNEANNYEQRVRVAYAWSRELAELLGERTNDPSLVPPRFSNDKVVVSDSLRALVDGGHINATSVSLEAFVALFSARDQIPNVLKQCDQLNRLTSVVPTDYRERLTSAPAETDRFRQIATDLAHWTEDGTTSAACVADRELTVEAPTGLLAEIRLTHDEATTACVIISQLADREATLLSGLMKRKEMAALRDDLRDSHAAVADLVAEHGAIAVRDALQEQLERVTAARKRFPFLTSDYFLFGFRGYPSATLQADLDSLPRLEFSSVADAVTHITGKALPEITFSELVAVSEHIVSLGQYMSVRSEVEEFAAHVGVGIDDLPKLYTTLKEIGGMLDTLCQEDVDSLQALFDSCEAMFIALGITRADLSTLFRFTADKARAEHLFRFIDLHGELSALPDPLTPDRKEIDEFFTKTQKLLERTTDERFGNLLNHMGDVARLQTAIEAGKRMSSGQARVLLDNLSCIISEPGLISQHFPMDPDMIDLLVIDEASQVSIAESISLMLRAKQTVVFGDELQYGAVGAVNVSQRYSEYYFKDILSDFAENQNVSISDEERDRLSREASATPSEEDEESSRFIPVDPGTCEWLKTFSVRTSTLAFAKALQNYSASLNTHFRSFPEIISYSNDVFYRPSQIELITNRIRTKPIGEVLRFLRVTTKGMSGRNVNLDEIETIQKDIERVVADGYEGTIGVICSFKEQAARMDEQFRKDMPIHPELVRNHKFRIWFVGDVQGEERHLVYYSFVQDKQYDNADLKTIYPKVGGTADNIRRLKMQRLNVGFSRAKDIMVFVHSMEIGEYSDTRLGDALRHYDNIRTTTHDHYIEDESVFDSPAEKNLYSLLVQTPFFAEHRDALRLVAQFEIGKYIRQEFRRYIPQYRVDFLLTKTDGGKEKSLIIEYDGVEFHTKNPEIVTAQNFDREYLDYDVERQLELESYGYSFLRINKFSLAPTPEHTTPVAMLDRLLRNRMDRD